MKKTIFTGAATALITPFSGGKVDYDAMGRLIEQQISGGISALVIAGTTGEGSTLTDGEHRDVISFAVEKTAKRVPVIAGTGSNDTSYAVELSKFAVRAGADALLLITPYYNKATQEGIYLSFKALADCCNLPCILYNVPSRTGCNLLPATARKIEEIENIVDLKEARGSISQIDEPASICGDSLDIYSGNDDQIVPIMSLGGKGVISVLSNLLPGRTNEICKSFLSGDIKTARELQLHYLPLINALFSEVNPIPVKAAMARLGLCENTLRLPLTPMEPSAADRLYSLMSKEGLI